MAEPAEILIIDDNEQSRAVVRALLELDGHRVLEAATGQAAIDRIAQRRPDLVLLDVYMPDLDGFAVTRWIRANVRRFVPVILLTAADDPELLQQGVEAGADEVLRKPMTATELRLRVRAMLRIARLAQDLRQAKRRLLEIALTDELTGVMNLRGFRSALSRELHRVRRRGGDLSLILFDVDHFKRVNDEHGHAAGDVVLRDVARALVESARDMDLVARIGGEEFVVLAPDAGPADALRLAERLRTAASSPPKRLPDGELLAVTLSAGVATVSQFADCTPDLLLASADRALYGAKSAGRNRTEQARRLRADEPTLAFRSPSVIEAGVVGEVIEDEASMVTPTDPEEALG